MNAAFDGVSDDTFDNVLGGVHALVFEDGELIGHASVVQRRLLHGGRALRTGYIDQSVPKDLCRQAIQEGRGGTAWNTTRKVSRTQPPEIGRARLPAYAIRGLAAVRTG